MVVRLGTATQSWGISRKEYMLKNLWRNSKPRELPLDVQTALKSQFRLESEALGRLRLFGQSGRFASRPVRFIRLVDSALLTADKKSSLKYSSFENGNYGDAVQFDGHIEREGYVLLHDRRRHP